MKDELREKLDSRLADLPVMQYEVINTDDVVFSERTRYICETECPRYGRSWACPPAVGTVEECRARCGEYDEAIIFSTVSEVPDIGDLEETLKFRKDHEDITRQVKTILEDMGFETMTLSTESCMMCDRCAYPDAPCRHPDKMFPCVESYGILVTSIAENLGMDFIYGGNIVVWFSLIFMR